MDRERLLENILRCIEPYEFRSFVIGFERPEGYDRVAHEAAFRDLKRALGEEISRRHPGTDADFLRPDIRIDVSREEAIRIKAAPIFIAGRYRKLSRDIPAMRWIHHACRGAGCPSCSHTGNLCGPSIQELLEGPVLELSGGETTLFHGLGREDTDARMLGRGRPFVLEVHAPRRRTMPIASIQEQFASRAQGLAEVACLVQVGFEARDAVKRAEAEKTYRAWIEPDCSIPESAGTVAQGLAGIRIDQASPTRVAHRRGRGAHRLRTVVESSWLGEVSGRHAWEVRVEAGLYVKELVSGDNGRTRPSLSEALGVPCRCAALDVLEIHWSFPWERT